MTVSSDCSPNALYLAPFTSRCYAERAGAVMPRQVVCPSVCDGEVSWTFVVTLEFLKNNFTAD